jgi:hypothetical protein
MQDALVGALSFVGRQMPFPAQSISMFACCKHWRAAMASALISPFSIMWCAPLMFFPEGHPQPARSSFFLSRHDAAVLGEGRPSTAERWLVQGWKIVQSELTNHSGGHRRRGDAERHRQQFCPQDGVSCAIYGGSVSFVMSGAAITSAALIMTI